MNLSYEYLFGASFFKVATDNTIVGIFAGRGILGIIAYLFFLLSLIKMTPQINNQRSLFIALLACFIFSSLTDYYGQRKIIYFFSILIAYSCIGFSVNKKRVLRLMKIFPFN